MALFLLQTVAFAVLAAADHFSVLLLPVVVIALCYGGGFGTMPALATDVFGAKNTGAIYGAMLTAWSAGAIVGPLLIAAVPYRTALALIAGLVAVASVLPLVFNARGAPAAARLRVSDPAGADSRVPQSGLAAARRPTFRSVLQRGPQGVAGRPQSRFEKAQRPTFRSVLQRAAQSAAERQLPVFSPLQVRPAERPALA
jgi:Major Facilitator Superfamily